MFGIDSKVSEDMKVINTYDIKYQLYLMSNKELSVSLEIAFLFCHEYRGSLINKTKYCKGKQAETEGSASF